MRYYAGMPLITPEGHKLGTLCVIDKEPRLLSEEQRTALRTLAKMVIVQLEMRLQVVNLQALQLALEYQRKLTEEKNDKLVASINYGQRIQKATMPGIEQMQTLLGECFVLLKPRDIVSGDTYWCTKRGHKVLLAAIDCTGHGVPGAMLAMLAQSLLNEIVNVWSITSPELILYELHRKVRQILNQAGGTNQDGMDMALCVIDKKTGVLEYAGAKNPMYLIQEGNLLEVKGDKQPIGGLQKEEERLFVKHSFSLKDISAFYLFSDGYTDQFGGEDGGKFMAKRLRALLLSIHHLPMEEQREKLAMVIENWMGNERQIDDILMVGVGLR
jgi:serine phosphatase RsbU (regulator of sigma subunit)